MVLFSLGGRAWDQHGSSAQLPVLALRAGPTVAWPRVPGIQFTRPQGLCASVYVCLLVSVSAGLLYMVDLIMFALLVASDLALRLLSQLTQVLL